MKDQLVKQEGQFVDLPVGLPVRFYTTTGGNVIYSQDYFRGFIPDLTPPQPTVLVPVVITGEGIVNVEITPQINEPSQTGTTIIPPSQNILDEYMCSSTCPCYNS